MKSATRSGVWPGFSETRGDSRLAIVNQSIASDGSGSGQAERLDQFAQKDAQDSEKPGYTRISCSTFRSSGPLPATAGNPVAALPLATDKSTVAAKLRPRVSEKPGYTGLITTS